MRKETTFQWHTGKLSKPMKLLVVSDLHDTPYEDLLPLLCEADCLLVAGDVVDRYNQRFSRGVAFLAEASKRLPTFFGVGNHELRLQRFEEFREAVKQTDAVLLFNEYASFGEVKIGCWFQPEKYGQRDMMSEFEQESGCKILLCHRPEDYAKYLHNRNVDLVLAGHAHGGQIRLFGQGLYAPGQGILPKYTHGVYGRMIVSAGAGNSVLVPRWGNPCEVVRVELD